MEAQLNIYFAVLLTCLAVHGKRLPVRTQPGGGWCSRLCPMVNTLPWTVCLQLFGEIDADQLQPFAASQLTGTLRAPQINDSFLIDQASLIKMQ